MQRLLVEGPFQHSGPGHKRGRGNKTVSSVNSTACGRELGPHPPPTSGRLRANRPVVLSSEAWPTATGHEMAPGECVWVASPSRGPCRTLRRGPGGGLGTHPATHQLGRVRQPLRCSGLQPPHFESTPAGLDDVGGTLPGQSGPQKEGHLTQGGGGVVQP